MFFGIEVVSSLCCPTCLLDQCHLLSIRDDNWNFKGLIEPGPQVAVTQQIESQQAAKFDRLHAQVDLSNKNFNNNIAINALHVHSVFAGSYKREFKGTGYFSTR